MRNENIGTKQIGAHLKPSNLPRDDDDDEAVESVSARFRGQILM